MRSPGRRRFLNDVMSFGAVGLLLWGVTFLPPDTTLQHVQASGVLRACVPDSFEPLVTGDAERPGIDVELLRAVATELDLRLTTVTNSAIGRDFNPRNWRITRAQCLILAGGIVDTTTTRGFLVVTTPHLETGWAGVHLEAPPRSLDGVEVGFFAGLSGLDRLALSRWLRSQGAVVTVVSDERSLIDGLRGGRFTIGVSEALTARRIAERADGTAVWLPLTENRVPLAFGMWKGDLTLERAVGRALRTVRDDGRLDLILETYALAPITSACPFCE